MKVKYLCISDRRNIVYLVTEFMDIASIIHMWKCSKLLFDTSIIENNLNQIKDFSEQLIRIMPVGCSYLFIAT